MIVKNRNQDRTSFAKLVSNLCKQLNEEVLVSVIPQQSQKQDVLMWLEKQKTKTRGQGIVQ